MKNTMPRRIRGGKRALRGEERVERRLWMSRSCSRNHLKMMRLCRLKVGVGVEQGVEGVEQVDVGAGAKNVGLPSKCRQQR